MTKLGALAANVVAARSRAGYSKRQRSLSRCDPELEDQFGR